MWVIREREKKRKRERFTLRIDSYIVGAGKFVIYRAGHQARGLGKRSCRSHEFEGRIVSSFGYLSLFLLWPSTD